jgi:hypothetical protein
MPPPGTHILQLPPPIADYFATLPWSDSPRHRYIEKALLLKAIADKDIQEADRAVKILYERDANGMRHWRWPEFGRRADIGPMRTQDAETDTAT